MRTLARILAWSLLAVLAAAGLLAAVYWVPDRPVGELKARWAPPPSQFVEIAGMQVHLRDEGPRDDAAPIVLLHGTSASLHTWEGWAQVLSKHRRVIRYDLPGFGLTGPAPDADYSIERYVQVLIAVMDKLGVQHAVVGGNSLGGGIAWAAAVFHSERVERLILVDAGGYPFESVSKPIGFRIAQIPVLGPLAIHVLPRGVIESSVRNVYGDPSKVTPELVDRYYELTTRAGNRDALVARMQQQEPGALAQHIHELKQPTLILWGGRDRLIPPEFAQRFNHDIAGSRLVVFDDLGHVPQEEDPARTVQAVEEFLAQP